MATVAAQRGNGYGLLLLQAAERLVVSLGETDIFLHLRWAPLPWIAGPSLSRCRDHSCSALTCPLHCPLPSPPPVCRVQDVPAARLYEKAGYRQVAADIVLVRLLGLDQRRLMRKTLPRQQA